MRISPQAVFKIRNKLESSGIIKGYSPIIDYNKIGISVICILIIQLTSKIWNAFTDDQISNNIAQTTYVIDAYRVSDEKASHILVMGFRNTHQKEQYVATIQTKYAEDILIRSTYTFSTEKIITHNSLGLLREIIDKKPFSSEDIFLP